MADVKVTREHRAAAQAKRFPTSMTRDERSWVETGERSDTGTMSLPQAAELVAETEHRVRADIIAKLRGLLDASVMTDVFTGDIIALVDCLEAQQS
jgi:hypothetical protein